MVAFSLKFHHRSAVYVLLAVCILVAYQIYNHARTLSRQPRSNTVGLSPAPKDSSRSVTSNKQRLTYVNSRRSKSISALHQELVKLKIKLREKDIIIKQLSSRYETAKIEKSKFQGKVAVLEGEVKKLRAKVEKALNFSKENFKDVRVINSVAVNKKSDNRFLPLGAENFKISEQEVFKTFTKTHVFESDTIVPSKEFLFRDRGPRKDTRTVKPSHRHITDAEDFALELINSNSSRHLRRKHVVDSVFRFDVHTGVDYEIYLGDPKDKSFTKVRLARTLTPLRSVVPMQIIRQGSELINIILPLSGRAERFSQFMDQFVEVCINRNNNVFLTVVLYGKSDFKHVKSILKNIELTLKFKKYQLIMRNKPFSRGRALHDGVMYWNGHNPNVLMFFCDVDITFSAEFLERCRMYSEPGRQVYYPMVFSLYNPRLVYEDGEVPSLQRQAKISRHHGMWRMFGYGMTCQHRQDYIGVGGFDLGIEGWGSEDRLLYQSYLSHQKFRIVRAPDRNLFHHWHEKHCDPSLKYDQYKQCIGSKARTQGSLVQIAMQLEKLKDKGEKDDKDEEPTEE